MATTESRLTNSWVSNFSLEKKWILLDIAEIALLGKFMKIVLSRHDISGPDGDTHKISGNFGKLMMKVRLTIYRVNHYNLGWVEAFWSYPKITISEAIHRTRNFCLTSKASICSSNKTIPKIKRNFGKPIAKIRLTNYLGNHCNLQWVDTFGVLYKRRFLANCDLSNRHFLGKNRFYQDWSYSLQN